MWSRSSILYLIANFVSTFGDALLVLVLPVGLALELKDDRVAVFMWLIPAIAMFVASFFGKIVKDRSSSSVKDFSLILVCIGLLEVTLYLLIRSSDSIAAKFFYSIGFVALYAFSKEGIPKLLYNTSIYLYFVDGKNYGKYSISVGILNIAAYSLAAIVGAQICNLEHWRTVLLVDTMTFFVFAYILFTFARKEQFSPPSGSDKKADGSNYTYAVNPRRWIGMVVPMLFGINALAYNYFPIINDRLAIADSKNSLLEYGLVRAPALLLGVWLVAKIVRARAMHLLLLIIPTAYLICSFLYVAIPMQTSFTLLLVTQGLLSSIYWPIDSTFRAKIDGTHLVEFNTFVLRSLAIIQFVACLCSLWVMKEVSTRSIYIPYIMFGVVLLAIINSQRLKGITSWEFN